MTEQEFRKAWGLDATMSGKMMMLDLSVLPESGVEQAFKLYEQTGYLIGFDPARTDDNPSAISVYKIPPSGEIVAEYTSRPPKPEQWDWSHLPYLRGKYMRGEPMTERELKYLEEWD